MAQRISRAKQLIKSSAIPFAEPGVADRAARLQSVLRVLYLIFNEGYASTEGAEFVRTDLSNEAIRLVRTLYLAHTDIAEIGGLLALMLLTDARRAARTGPAGELIPLDEQDRTQWDQLRIAEGVALISSLLSKGMVGPYQIQAAIAAIAHFRAAAERTASMPERNYMLAKVARLSGATESPKPASSPPSP